MRNLCGTDIIEIERIKKVINSLENTFINKIYTENEIKYCEEKNNAKYQHYAARFAAKEAVFKAISAGLKDKFEVSWQEIEILNDKNGRPYVVLPQEKSQNIENIDISISHCKDYAVANTVIMFKE